MPRSLDTRTRERIFELAVNTTVQAIAKRLGITEECVRKNLRKAGVRAYKQKTFTPLVD